MNYPLKKSILDNKNISRMMGSQLRLIRIAHGLSGVQVGRILGISQQQISRYERGITTLSIETILLLCDCFNVTPEYFLAPVLTNEKYSSNKIINGIEDVNLTL